MLIADIMHRYRRWERYAERGSDLVDELEWFPLAARADARTSGEHVQPAECDLVPVRGQLRRRRVFSAHRRRADVGRDELLT